MHGLQEFSRQKRLYNDVIVHFKNDAGFEKSAHLKQSRFMLYHERECKVRKMQIMFILCIYWSSYATFSVRRFIDVSIAQHTCTSRQRTLRFRVMVDDSIMPHCTLLSIRSGLHFFNESCNVGPIYAILLHVKQGDCNRIWFGSSLKN